ncbi:MAG: hypothetical protein M0008_03490 [Actinomycetota bacterium]|nr:hypothetical protein [Actinomycetota bacterium]
MLENSLVLGSTGSVSMVFRAVIDLSGGMTVAVAVDINDLSGTLETNDSAGVDTWTGGVAPNATGSSVSASSGAVLASPVRFLAP